MRETSQHEYFERQVRGFATRYGRTSVEVATAWANGEVWCPTCRHWWTPPRSVRRRRSAPCPVATGEVRLLHAV